MTKLSCAAITRTSVDARCCRFRVPIPTGALALSTIIYTPPARRLGFAGRALPESTPDRPHAAQPHQPPFFPAFTPPSKLSAKGAAPQPRSAVAVTTGPPLQGLGMRMVLLVMRQPWTMKMSTTGWNSRAEPWNQAPRGRSCRIQRLRTQYAMTASTASDVGIGVPSK